MIAVICLLVAAHTAAANAPRITMQSPKWLPKIWRAIALCETGGDWSFSNSSYVSAFGIYRGSWAQFRPAWVPAVPERATPRQQYAVASAIWRRYGLTGWGCYTHGGYAYWMARG